jgi:hypothetical protein
MADGLHKWCEEDQTLRVERRKNGQLVLSVWAMFICKLPWRA